tara:strand:- start:3571 stop:3720 length:150 start_codon:yes stop_codon:yes gene_type:complete
MTYTACEDGSLTVTAAGGIVVEESTWNSEPGVTWELVKAALLPEGAVCN